ncbi:MAG: DNA processing protein [Microgenomates group bacterium Gr01-1014_80]|nr:MAG: DNA processing protein [Microgenomates group bacterium Gr01-1014_80]
MMKNIQYLFALHLVEGLGDVRLKALFDHVKDWQLAWNSSEKELLNIGIPRNTVALLIETRKKLDPQEYMESIQKAGIKWLTIFDEGYPARLKQIYDPPTVFYYKGEFKPVDEKAIAVVGARKITGYGRMVTEKFTSELVAAGFTIVSGLARGVDCAAHRAALNSGGRTIAVLGGGLNKIYPPENVGLAEQIAEGNGVIMSEFPPDYPSVPGNFPARNRIISGLSLGVLVTEAAQDSGSLITARLGVEQGREVFAVPGPVTSDLSRGPADLIREGARLVFEAGEILEELGISQVQPFGYAQGERTKFRAQSLGNLSEEERNVLEVLENENRHIDEIGRILRMDAAKISAALLKMEINGLVKNLGSGVYCRV